MLPEGFALIEIDYNDVNGEGLTSFRIKDVIFDGKLKPEQKVIAYQPEDGTYAPALVKYVSYITFAGKIQVSWNDMKSYTVVEGN